MENQLLAIATALLTVTANGFAAMLFWRMKRMDADIEKLKQEINDVRFNYITRFEDVKDHNTRLHLQLLEKFSILDKGLAAHYAASQARELINKGKDKHDSN